MKCSCLAHLKPCTPGFRKNYGGVIYGRKRLKHDVMAEVIKHIKRKFQGERKDSALIAAMEWAGQFCELPDIHKMRVGKDQDRYLVTDEGLCIPCFEHRIDGKKYVIPEPDPVLIYFNNAQTNFRQIAESRKEVLMTLSYEKGPLSHVSEICHSLYNYMYQTSGFVIFLFTAVEAVINKAIPYNFKYRMDRNGKWIEEYDFEQIQKYLPFDTKAKNVLFQVTNKDFSKAHPNKWTHIDNLKKFRDTIIHTKKQEEHHTPYSYIFKMALNFNYAETILAVRDFINFYDPGLVEPCPCGKDF